MEALLASVSTKPLSIHRGDQVEGEVVFIGDKEVIIDFKSKSEGTLPLKDFSDSQREALKVGDKIKSYVIEPENESGQIVLSLNPAKQLVPTRPGGFHTRNSPAWNKLIQSKNQNAIVTGNVIEVNKGGLIVEVDGIRGFIPSSQIGEDAINGLVSSSDLVGQTVNVMVIEVDQQNNRLIFTQKSTKPSPKLDSYQDGQKVQGQVVAVLPFGLLVKLSDGMGGLVLNTEASWDRVEDLNALFKVGQEIEVIVTGKEKDLGRLTLSIRKTSSDPFTKLTETFQSDDVISGVVTAVTSAGVSFSLSEGVEGFMPSGKLEEGATYEVGKKISLLVDSIDANKRRVLVAPFLTTTKGLIYK